MALLEDWRAIAYDDTKDPGVLRRFWDDYFALEKRIYEQLLENPKEAVEGTVKELADKYDVDIMSMTGFLDGINESLKKENPIEEMDAETKVSLDFDDEKLFRNMIDAKADWLYTLPQWDKIFDADKQKELLRDQRMAHTVINGPKIGRNDPCPCGSGKKYKNCCLKKGAKA